MKNILIKGILITFISVSIILNICVSVIIISTLHYNEMEVAYQECSRKASTLRSLLLEKYMDEYQNIEISYVFDRKSQKIPIKTLNKKNILYVPQNSCEVCRDLCMMELKEHNFFKLDGIIVLFETVNQKEYEFLVRKYKLPIEKVFYTKKPLFRQFLIFNPVLCEINGKQGIDNVFLIDELTLPLITYYLPKLDIE